MDKKRDYGLDLLRIVSMLMVVCIHYLGNSGLLGELELWTPNWFAGQTVFACCMVAVNCFVLITGFFMCENRFRLAKWVNVWVQTMFYSVGIFMILTVSGVVPFSALEILKSGMVLTLKRYWFVTAYLLLYAISPFLNCAIGGMSQRMHLLCCCILLGIYSFLHNVVYICDFGGVNGGTGVMWFSTLYMVAAYLRKYVHKEKIKSGTAVVVFACCTLALVGARAIAYWITPYVFGRVVLTDLFFTRYSVIVVAGSIALFLAFCGLDIQRGGISKIISKLAPCSFAVYLIHEQPELRAIIWKWLDPCVYADSAWMVVHMAVCVTVIFVVCCVTECLRRWLFRITRIDTALEMCCFVIQNKTKKILDNLIF